MSAITLAERVKKQTEKLAQTIAKQEAEKNAGVVKKAASDAAQKARLETLKAEQKRLADKAEAGRIKTRDAKLAHIFFRVMRKGMGDGWILECLQHVKASDNIQKDFSCLAPNASKTALLEAGVDTGKNARTDA